MDGFYQQERSGILRRIRRNFRSSVHLEDLLQEADIALWRYSDGPSPNRGGAWETARGAALMFLRDKAQVVRVPAYRYQRGERAHVLPLEAWDG